MGKYKGATGFLSDAEKMRHYMEVSGFSCDVYNFRMLLKIYEGGEILIYHFNSKGILVYDTVLMCTGFSASDKGMQATFVDRKDFKVTNVRDVPNKIAGRDLLTSMPVRCMIERTIKITASGCPIQGISAAIMLYMKSDPKDRIPGHHYAIGLTRVKKMFSPAEIFQAEERAAQIK